MHWTSIRTDEETAESLSRYRARLQVQVNRYPTRYPPWVQEKHISLSIALRYLLHQQGEHGRRAKKSREKRVLDTVIELVEDA